MHSANLPDVILLHHPCIARNTFVCMNTAEGYLIDRVEMIEAALFELGCLVKEIQLTGSVVSLFSL